MNAEKIKIFSFSFLFSLLFMFASTTSVAQTSWKGTVSISWKNSGNWTAGVPTSSVDAIIGDANFTGAFQPTISGGSAACKSLTIGAGTGSPVLTQNSNLTVSGGLTIASSGRLNQSSSSLSISGNWSNSGIYSGTSSNSKVTFTGTSQTISGSSATPFRKLTINGGSTVTLSVNMSVAGTFVVNGAFIPLESAAPLVSGTGATTLGATGTLKVNAATFAANYGLSGAFSLAAGSTVDYSATLADQTIKENLTYSTLRISGAGTKTAGGNLNALNSTTLTTGNITVSAGTLDLSTFTANRGTTVAGGTFTVSNSATLKIGGTNTFPANFNTRALSLTSTVEYSGTNQSVGAQTYGNLIFSSSSGAAVKTMPGTDFTVAGNFSSTINTGTSVSFTAASNITISGNVSIGASTTFNGGSFTHSISGNWVNAGTFTGATSTINLLGPGTAVSGTGTHNFNNLAVAASNITGAATSNITVSGNLSSSGSGSFTHSSGGTFTMSGTTKTITGTGFTFDDLTISGSVSASGSITLTGNLAVSGSLSNSSNTITMSGAAKSISGAGTIGFSGLFISGSVTTANNFSVANSLNVDGSLTASAGTVTFTGTSTLNGTANLFNVNLNGTSLQLSTNAVLGIAGAYTITSGTLNVTSTTPNTVNYNGGSQTVTSSNYGNLMLSNGNTKTAGGVITVNGDITIAASTTFNASSFTHTVNGNWTTAGTFTAGLSTVTLAGTRDVTISGTNAFNTLTVNKSAATNQVVLLNDADVATLNVTSGGINTGSNLINITSSRTGNGIILGTIKHTHSFVTGVPYSFEGPDNTITFTTANTLSAVTVTVTKGSISDFPFSGSINRVYNIALTGTASTATLRLHYEDAELNGNTESSMQFWHYNGSAWVTAGKTSNSTTSNYVELTGIPDVSNRWTFSDDANLVRWNGSVSSDWFTAANWTTVQGSPSLPPSAADVVEIGTAAFTNQPTINGSAVAKNIILGSAQAVTLTLTGGSLTTQGNINGVWLANATHTINTNSNALTVNGDIVLSDGTSGHAINLNIGSGTTTVTGSVTESGGANITFTGAGTLKIGNNFNYVSGTFTPGSGAVVFNGTGTQTIAGISYNDLTINKTTGIAAINAPTTVAGNLSVSAGELDINAASTITGNVTIATGATLNGDGVTTTVGGNWNNSGTFLSLSGTILLNGTGAQTVTATTFNNLTINKSGGTVTLTGNLSINGNLTLTAGTLDLSTFNCNRSSAGGTFTASAGTSVLVGGGNNLPANYSTYVISAGNTLTFNGSVAQTVPAATFGNLVFSNSGTKTLTGSITVSGDFTLNGGATLNADSYTINLAGNWVNSGTFTAGTSTVILNGSSKTITGNTTFNKITINGTYTVSGSNLTFNGLLLIAAGGSFNAGSGSATVSGDLTNAGSLVSNGITTFTGTSVQTIRLLSAITSNSSGVINFNGSVSPVLNSTSAPIFATLNVNNTAGINPSVGWTVAVAFNVSSGATFNGGNSTHNILGSFTNNGTVTSSGIMNFIPSATQTITLVGTSFTSTGTVVFGGSGAISVAGIPTSLNNVTISNSNGVTPAAGWTVGGTFQINSTGIFNAGANTYTINGDVESNGTLNGGTSLFTMSSATGQLSGSPSTTFYDFTVTGTIAANSDFNVSHNFTNNNVFDTSVGTLIMTGSGASVIGGTASPFALAQFAISKTGATTTLAKNVTSVIDLHISSGTLDASTFTIAQDVGGGSLTIDDNATLKIGGTNTLPTFGTYAIDTLSTVEYNGGTQAVSAAASYGNLTISTTGTKTASAALHMLNNFSLSTGTFVAGSFTHIVDGNWSMTSGTFTNTGSTILFSGTATQSISSTGAFNNLSVNKTSTNVTLSANVTVNGVLNFIAGKIQTGSSNSVILPAAGSVTGAAQSSGWVYGRLQKNVAIGLSISRTFEIGDSTSYTPATALFASVTIAGNFSAVVTKTDHPNLAASGINSTKSVNRYWSFTNSSTAFTTASVTVNWVAADLDAGVTTSSFKVGNYNGSTWTLPTVASPTSTSIQATGLTAIGDIAVGEVGTTKTFSGTGNFSSAARWSGGTLPVAGDNLIINGACTVDNNAGTDNVAYGTLTIGTSTGRTLNWATSGTNRLNVSDVIAGSAASTLDMTNGGTLIIRGTWSSTNLTFTSGAGTIEMRSTTTLPAAYTTYKNLTINGSGNTVSLGAAITISGNLTITAGTFSANNFNAIVNGNWINNGSFTPGTATVTFNATTVISGTTTTNIFNNLTLGNSSTVTSSTGITGLVVNGTLYVDWGALLNLGTTTVLSGTLLGTSSINGTIRTFVITTTSPVPVPAGKTWGGTIEYATSDGGQTVVAGTYNNLTILAQGPPGVFKTSVAGGNLVVNGTFVNWGWGVLDMGASYIFSGTLTGLFNYGNIRTSVPTSLSATPIPAGKTWIGTIEYSAPAGSQTVMDGTYDILQFNNTSGNNTMAGNITVNVSLVLTGGTITTGANTLYLGASGGVSRTSGHIVGNFKKNIATGATSKTFEIGDATNYTPVTVAFASVTTAGDLTAKVTAAEHPNLAGSGIRTDKSVNRYFTLTNAGTLFTSASLTANWVAGDVDAGSTTANFKVGKYNSPTWILPSVASPSATSIQATGLTSFGDFAVGELCASSSAFSYGGSPYCPSGTATPTITGTAGTFTSTAGLSINASTGVVDLAASTVGTYTVTNTSLGGCSSFATASITITAGGTWSGAVSTNWNTSGNWQCGAIPTSTMNVTIPGSLTNYPVLNSGTAAVKNITIASGASLTVSGATLQIAGSISNSGTFTASSGTIEMNGSSAQAIPASTFAGNTVNNFTINNASGVTLSGTLNVGGILLASSGQLTTGGFLTLLSTATQTALIDGSGAGTISGNVTMQRYLAAGFGYKYFSSPFQAATVSNFSSTVDLGAAFANFYTYIENQASSGFTSYTTGTNILYPLQGYAADFGAVNVSKTINITGTVNNGSLSATLYNHNQPYTEGFNLVGNPYPSPIDWNAASGWNRTNIDNAIYYFDSGTTSQYTGTYSTYINGVSSDGIAGNIIASMQGFFVHVSNGTYPVTGTFSTNNNVRVNNLSPVFHKSTFSLSSPAPRTLLRLSANFADNTQASDPLVVYSNEKATAAFDSKLDAIKLMNTNEQIPNLYLQGSGKSKLVINALDKIDTLTVIPLGLQLSKDGSVTFNLRDLEQWPFGVRLYLSDAETGVNHDLQQDPKFTIALKSGTYENRFSLRCIPIKATANSGKNDDVFYVYRSNGATFIRVKLITDTQGTLLITNMAGRVVLRKTVNQNGDIELDRNMSADGIFVASFQTQNGVYAKKFFW